MRSNLAIVNGGPEPVTLRVRLEGPNGEDLGVLSDWTLPAWGWKQFDRPLEGKATSGRAVVTRLSGTSPFSAYGVLNDSGTSDGSFVPPLVPGVPGAADRMIPVVLDVKGLGTSRYATEVTLANLGSAPLALTLAYSATAQFGGGSGSVPLTLAAGEQRIIPDAISFLRAGGLAIPGGRYERRRVAPREGACGDGARRSRRGSPDLHRVDSPPRDVRRLLPGPDRWPSPRAARPGCTASSRTPRCARTSPSSTSGMSAP